MNHTHNDQNNVLATWGVSNAVDPTRKSGLRINNDCLTVGLYDKNGVLIVGGSASGGTTLPSLTVTGTSLLKGNVTLGVPTAATAFAIGMPTATSTTNSLTITGQTPGTAAQTGGAVTIQGGLSTTSGAGGAAKIQGGTSPTGTGGAVTIIGGTNSSAGTGGAVIIDGGVGASTAGSILLGGASQAVTISVAGKVTTVAGSLTVTQAVTLSSTLATVGQPTFQNATAPPAAGLATAGILFSSTASFGTFFGSGAPTFAAAQGSVYYRTDGSSTSTRLYINTTGSTTWTNVTTAA